MENVDSHLEIECSWCLRDKRPFSMVRPTGKWEDEWDTFLLLCHLVFHLNESSFMPTA